MKRVYEDDDGRVIAPMQGLTDLRSRKPSRLVQKETPRPTAPATRREALVVGVNALLAALVVAGVFMLAIGGIIYLMTLWQG